MLHRARAAAVVAVAVLGMTAVVGQTHASPATAVEILPHRALYKVTLDKAASGSSIVDVQGRMGFEWRDACDGWAVEQRYAMEFSRADGDGSVIQSTYSTWESKAGDIYRFFVKRDRGGGEERIEGKAVMPLPLGSGPGKVTFAEPELQELKLPKDTLFPTEHTIRMIAAATSGKRFLRAPVFDGGEPEAPSLISAVLGKGKDDVLPSIKSEAVQGTYYPSRLAWFGPDSEGSEPDFEMSIEVLANGIARLILVHYSDFSVRMSLEEVEALPAPDC
ncbi:MULTISPECIES: EipB family protein [Thalassobaculum]|uniref:DUF1849 family protein n=1 Tax=Thalassobaculum litoreum DSM 18839 TaxID=1123362 RepID=A0A8G2BLQ7_9PROT|nr:MULTISPECIES: DUF1849 family protein [Thalassobaculum]SDG43473.1 protein of unknown function [Thalassobaculum litoreum DSM 18839]